MTFPLVCGAWAGPVRVVDEAEGVPAAVDAFPGAALAADLGGRTESG